jgi:chromosomal replication initiator protein
MARPMHTDNAARVRASEIEAIERAVAYFFGMAVEELHDKNRRRAVIVPRQIAIYLISQMTDVSLSEIGCHFGGKYKSRVMHSIARVREQRRTRVGVDLTISILVRTIKARHSPRLLQ